MERNLEIVSLYQNGMTTTELVNKFNLHRSTIQRILLRNGVTLHKNKSLIKCDKNFFSIYSPESCYWAGFILADGCLRFNRNSLEIKLAIKDKEHLINFLKTIKCENHNLIKVYKEGTIASLAIHLDEFKRDLINNFDITPQKTFTTKLSDKIPNNMLPHLIRGYFDGDGSITKTTTLSINFVGTVSLLSSLSHIFYNNCSVRLKSKNEIPPIQSLNKGVGAIHYSGQNAQKILNYLYQDKIEFCFLNRKFKKYHELKL